MIRHDWLRTFCTGFTDPLQRERERIRTEMAGIWGLLGLLMKQRNGAWWATEERRRLGLELRRVVALCPYLLALLAPGSFVLLPVVAWWLDRRRQSRCVNHVQPARPLTMSR
ncbi:protein of unknown function [Nitrospira japonica]|uniref:Uncharacterized protein n=1 Tax=Nitrospira japonica TaxID=1325564 RepID=A0A1W1I0C9_9BACT|nr:protein of unknown function [Nitrospira japonica]